MLLKRLIGILTSAAMLLAGFTAAAPASAESAIALTDIFNTSAVTNPQLGLTPADAVNDGAIKLSFGKKRHVLLRPE